MATNKNASIRYQTLDQCFRDPYHRYYLKDLIEKCEEALRCYNGTSGVSRRQIFEDIKFMESEAGWRIPLERIKDGKSLYYRYSPIGFSINAQPLSDDEARQLEAAVLTLNRFRGLPSNEWINDIISSLEWRFHLKRSEQNVISFEQNKHLRGLSLLSPLIDATLRQQVLSISYQSYKELAVKRQLTVHPYYLKAYNNRWYLLALDADTGYLCTLALDRIYDIAVCENIRYINNKTDFDTYFDEVIGITVPDATVSKEHIVLQFSAHQYPYVLSKPLHSTQTVIDDEQRLISIDVKPNYELDYHILALGPAVEVLEPTSYRAHIRQKLSEMLQRYAPVQNDCTPNE